MPVTLTVYEPVTKPKITSPTTQPKEYDTFTLTCDTSKPMTITWTRRGARISSEARSSRDNSTLTFSSVKRGDSGEYRCEAQNLGSKESSDPYKVSVAYTISEEYSHVGLVLGLTFAIILGVVLLIVGSICLYKKFSTRRLNESLETRQKDIPVYENVQAPQVKEESTYTDLQFRSEDTYTDLRR
ncbi:carcinoembryonic antigen-related cell adhesion molecule 1-like [Eleutherodactylus coqui]|uniref:carcinoembryonic antigen-related cell adhesion molecule 1-like n=1 Tax=Eleutherodactylus coqui TaxID=57060 RepID=UPI003463185C